MTFSNLIEHAAVENTYKKTEKKELEQHFNFLAQDFLSPFLRLFFFSPSFDSLSADSYKGELDFFSEYMHLAPSPPPATVISQRIRNRPR